MLYTQGFPHFEPKLQDLTEDILQLVWDLATVVPPLVPSCKPQYSEEEQIAINVYGQGDGNNMEYRLSYLRPILYDNSFDGSVLVRGEVIYIYSDAGTQW